MRINNKSLIYLYNGSEPSQKSGLDTLKQLQHYHVSAIDIKQEVSKPMLDYLEKVLASNNAAYTIDKDALLQMVENEPDKVSTPLLISVEKVLQLDADDDASFSQQLSWLDK